MIALEGRRIWITRAAEDARAWIEVIERLGGHAEVFPCLRVEPIRDDDTAARLREGLRGARWLAVTSRHGVDGVAALLAAGALPARLRVAAVGEATAARARERLGRCDLAAPGGTGRDLALALAARLGAAARIVAAGADRARRDLEEVLTPLGAEVLRIAVYRTIPAPPLPPGTPRRPVRPEDAAAILLASPSAAEGLHHRAAVDPAVTIVTIGPTTTRAARALGLHVTAEARRRGIDGMLEALP